MYHDYVQREEYKQTSTVNGMAEMSVDSEVTVVNMNVQQHRRRLRCLSELNLFYRLTIRG